MNRYEELANEIIDIIEDWITTNYPHLSPINFSDDEDEKQDIDRRDLAIINGSGYYNLESEIANRIRDLFSLYGICKWWIETYPKDIFVGKTKEIKEIVEVRKLMEKILARGVAEKI